MTNTKNGKNDSKMKRGLKMTDEIKCPECKKEMKLLPQRQPLPEPNTGGTSLTLTAATITYSSYSSTSKTFKCSNDECWVTKLELSWS